MFNSVGSPYASKRLLYFGWAKFFAVVKDLASNRSLKFPDHNGAKELIAHYEETWNSLAPLGSSLKAAAKNEKREKDELEAKEKSALRERRDTF